MAINDRKDYDPQDYKDLELKSEMREEYKEFEKMPSITSSGGTFSYDPTKGTHTAISSAGSPGGIVYPSTTLPYTPPLSTGYYPEPELNTSEHSDTLEVIKETKIEVIEDILDDLDACGNTNDIVKVIAKLQRKLDRLKGSDSHRQGKYKK